MSSKYQFLEGISDLIPRSPSRRSSLIKRGRGPFQRNGTTEAEPAAIPCTHILEIICFGEGKKALMKSIVKWQNTIQRTQMLLQVQIAAMCHSALWLEYISLLKKKKTGWNRELGAFHHSQCSNIYFPLSSIIQSGICQYNLSKYASAINGNIQPINHQQRN